MSPVRITFRDLLCVPWEQVESTNVELVAYEGPGLVVEGDAPARPVRYFWARFLNGSIYRYEVPEELDFDTLRSGVSESAGKTIGALKRAEVPCSKVVVL